ncbi:MAG TPA: rod shape-determining protein MreC [Solirubrobacterales bacterium]
MYRKQVRRRRAVLVALVIVSLILLSLSFSEADSGPIHSIQRGLASVFGPIEEGAGRALKPVRDAINWFDETFDARGENDRLQDELTELRADAVDAEAIQAENDELRKALDFKTDAGIEGYTQVTSRVIARSPTVWYSQVTIDQGSSSGIERDDPVVTGDGLVGKVSDTTAGTAQVTLITDHRSAVSARVLTDGPLGVVKPEVGDPDDLLLDFIQEDREVAKGQRLVTAGSTASDLESLFPPGIPIGEVTNAELQAQDTYQRVHLKPFADLRDFEYVQVLTGGDGE